jgi:hypothetical protein
MATRFGSINRRRFATGILAFAALGTMAMTPTMHASADSPNGHISIGAKLCLDSSVDPLTCPDASVGGIGLAEANGNTYLGMGDAVADGESWVWGEGASIVPLTSYFIETNYLDVPAGWEINNLIPAVGDAGGSENGWYVTLTDAQPTAELYFIYTPLDYVDSDGDGLSDYQELDVLGTDAYDADPDGDGAPDSDEIAFGSDPFDASSFPAVQAGPEDDVDTDGDGASDSAENAFGSDPNDPYDFPAVQAGPEPKENTGVQVSSLPNTGSGEAEGPDGHSDEIIYVASAGLLIAGAIAGKRMRRNG